MLSTGTMIKLGKVYGNMMVDVKATNAKLSERARRIVMAAAGCTRAEAITALEATGGHAKPAILIAVTGCSPAEAHEHLSMAHGHLERALKTFPGHQ